MKVLWSRSNPRKLTRGVLLLLIAAPLFALAHASRRPSPAAAEEQAAELADAEDLAPRDAGMRLRGHRRSPQRSSPHTDTRHRGGRHRV